MKKIISYLSILFIMVLVMVFAQECKKGGGAGENEPNNTIEEAGEIHLGEIVTISIDPVGDYDYFKVEVPEQGYLNIQASTIPENLNLEVSFRAYQEWEAENEKEIRPWHRLPDAVFMEDSGVLYFVIHDDYDDQASGEKIEIKAEFIPEFDPTEPNNSPEEAKEVEFTDLNLAVFPVGDRDWLKIIAPGQGYIKAMTKNVPEGITPEIYYATYDEWADPKTQELRSWRRMPDACFIPDSGLYYLLFHDDYDDQAVESVFDLKLEFLPEMDPAEPNNIRNDAKPVKRGDTINLAIFPAGDRDYYKISLKEGDRISFMASNYETITPEIILQMPNPANPEEMIDISGWSRFPAEFEINSTGDIFLLFHDDYDDQGSEKVFTVRIE